MKEEDITKELLKDNHINDIYYLSEPIKEREYNHFKYDLVIKSKMFA